MNIKTGYRANVYSVFAAITNALGFVITDLDKASKNYIKMVDEFRETTVGKLYMLGYDELAMIWDIDSNIFYIPGAIIQWVQSWWAGKGGAYDEIKYGFPTYTVGEEIPETRLTMDEMISIMLYPPKNLPLLNGNVFSSFYDYADFGTDSFIANVTKLYNGIKNHFNLDNYYDNIFFKFNRASSNLITLSILVLDDDQYTTFENKISRSANRVYNVSFYSSGSSSYYPVAKIGNSGTGAVKAAYYGSYRLDRGTIEYNGGGATTEYFGTSIPFPDLNYLGGGSKTNWTCYVSNRFPITRFYPGGGVSRGGGVGRHHLPQNENFPPCGGPTSEEALNVWTERVINWDGNCFLPLTIFKTTPWNETTSVPDIIQPNMEPEQPTSWTGTIDTETRDTMADNDKNTSNGGQNLPEVQSNGLISLWHPTIDQLSKLVKFMNGSTFAGVVANVLGSPMNNIISLAQWPITPVDGNLANPVLGGTAANVSLPLIAKQYHTVDCGSIEIPRRDNIEQQFLDYEPYTRVMCYLPFVGMVRLSTNDVMGKTIHLTYNADFATGTTVAQIFIDNVPYYSYPCNICSQLPITSTDAANLFIGLASAAGTAISGNAMAQVAGGRSGERMAAFDNIRAAGQAAGSFVNAFDVSHGGSLTGNAGLLGELKPFIVIYRSTNLTPKTYKNLRGQQCSDYSKLGLLSGYTVVSEVHVEIPFATTGEKEEIERLLKEGVIL